MNPLDEFSRCAYLDVTVASHSQGSRGVGYSFVRKSTITREVSMKPENRLGVPLTVLGILLVAAEAAGAGKPDAHNKRTFESRADAVSRETVVTRRAIADPVDAGGQAAGCTFSTCDPATYCFSGTDTACVQQSSAETAWRVCVRDTGRKGIWLGPVYFKRSPSSPWMDVIYDAGLAEIFVPYHEDTTFRPYDMQFCPNTPGACMHRVTTQDAGPNGTLVTLAGETAPTIVAESCLDRGIAWMCKDGSPPSLTSTSASRRGQGLLIWGVYDGGNYDNIIQYGFHDDGRITFRMGNTGYTSPAHSQEAHMHTGLWRVDMDLNGAGGDTVRALSHREPLSQADLLKAEDVFWPPFCGTTTCGPHEGWLDWADPEFTSVVLTDASVNSYGNNIGYELVPVRSGKSLHFGYGEEWTLHDFYVTVFHSSERLNWIDPHLAPNSYVLAHFSDEESIVGNDVILWYKSAAHHDPHDEDHEPGDPSNVSEGITFVHWSGFDLVPHNLFDSNPLGGPGRCN